MQDMGAIFRPLVSGRLRSRLVRRQLDVEARVNEVPPRPGHEKTLSEHIPSPLIAVEDRIRAMAIGGAPAWSRRLKRIYDLADEITESLRTTWAQTALAAKGRPDRFAAAWTSYAEHFNLSKINQLIADHNRYFPAEANLAMDIRTMDYVEFGGADYRRKPLDARWILEQFPPDLDAALAQPIATSAAPIKRYIRLS